MISVQSAGYFDQSDKMVKMVLAVVTATGTVMLPHVANAFARGESSRTKDLLYESFSFVTALSMPMTFGLAAVAPKFVPLFFTNKFVSVTPIMMIESFVILLIAWSNAIGTQYLLPTKQTKKYTTSVVLGAVVNLVANIPLILMYGAIGSAVATVLSELSVTVYQIYVIRNQIKYKNLFEDISKYLSAGILMFIIVFWFNQIFSDNWISLILEVIIGIMTYLVLLVALRAKLIKRAIKLIKHD